MQATVVHGAPMGSDLLSSALQNLQLTPACLLIAANHNYLKASVGFCSFFMDMAATSHRHNQNTALSRGIHILSADHFQKHQLVCHSGGKKPHTPNAFLTTKPHVHICTKKQNKTGESCPGCVAQSAWAFLLLPLYIFWGLLSRKEVRLLLYSPPVIQRAALSKQCFIFHNTPSSITNVQKLES